MTDEDLSGSVARRRQLGTGDVRDGSSLDAFVKRTGVGRIAPVGSQADWLDRKEGERAGSEVSSGSFFFESE